MLYEKFHKIILADSGEIGVSYCMKEIYKDLMEKDISAIERTIVAENKGIKKKSLDEVKERIKVEP